MLVFALLRFGANYFSPHPPLGLGLWVSFRIVDDHNSALLG
jgi:hypothetical protein